MAGKGLESLIPKRNNSDNTSRREDFVQKDYIFWVDIDKIKPNPYQPRKNFGEEELNSLSESIKKYGVLQPIIVTKTEDVGGAGEKIIGYEIIAGERRYRASKLAGLKQIPVIVKEKGNREKLEIALIENVQRKNLNPIDRAEALDQLKNEFSLTEKEIAQIAGMSREAVSNSLRILTLPEYIKQSLKQERLTEGHARALLSIKEPDIQKKVFEDILSNNYTVRDTEKVSRGETPEKKTVVAGAVVFENKDFFEKKLKGLFEYEKIKVNKKREKVQLVVDFDNENELRNWMRNLGNK
ncbi:MAG: ParB/RepB/Spo0J family partition protein [Candidatus Pacebacteria bacterium]|nr:ParB/RepB/Spo0J family partition protein [Candidatus Paceibacterota bacterium]